jgi:hypothetical protein
MRISNQEVHRTISTTLLTNSQTNTCHQQHEVLIQDTRPSIDKLDIDIHGFQMLRRRTSLDKEDFEDDGVVRAKYYPEVEALLKDVLGAARVFIWEHTVKSPFHAVIFLQALTVCPATIA